MEILYASEFLFENCQSIWFKIYTQKVIKIRIPKIREFNYKILHNYLACGKSLSKFLEISKYCEYCQNIESIKHMLYDCYRVKRIWNNVSSFLKCDITWKTIVCGFPKYSSSTKIDCMNYIISCIAYSVYKVNNICKSDKKVV